MSKSNGPPSTSSSGAPRYQSLVEILSAKSQPQLGMRTRADNKLQQFCLPNLDGSQGVPAAKLNLSRASIRSEENLIDASAIAERNRLLLEAEKITSQQNDAAVQQLKIDATTKINTRKNQFAERNHGKAKEHFSVNGTGGDTKTDIERFLKAIDKSASDFEEDDKSGILPAKFSGLNYIQLPTDFTKERGRINCYRSGIIEVISGDHPPKILRFKPTTTTDLLIATDKKIHIDQMTVYSPESLATNKPTS